MMSIIQDDDYALTMENASFGGPDIAILKPIFCCH